MDNKVKITIIVVILFISVLGIISNTHSNTLVIYPSLKTISNQTSNDSNLISPSEAVSIANTNIPAFGEVRYGVKYIQNGQNPYYMITIYGNDPGLNVYGQIIVVSKVDAKTGKLYV